MAANAFAVTRSDLVMESMLQLHHPSAAIRPIPAFTMEMPEGWIVTELPGALAAFGTPIDDDGPWANVILRHERTVRTMTLEVAARSSWSMLLAAQPDAEAVDERLMRFGDVIQYVRDARVPDADGGEGTRQIQSMFFGPTEDRLTLDLFEFTCLTPDVSGEVHLPAFAQVIGSLRFT